MTNPTGRGRSRAGIVVHRRNLERQDTTIRHGIPCTTAARTVFDCSRILNAEATEDMLMAADSKRILNRRRLEELVARHGSANLRELLGDDPRVTRSRNERRLFSICRRSTTPSPRRRCRGGGPADTHGGGRSQFSADR